MDKNDQDEFLTCKTDEDSGGSGNFASEAGSYHNASGYAECLASVSNKANTLELPCMSKSMQARSIRERKKSVKEEKKAMEQSVHLPFDFKNAASYSSATLFRDVRRSLLADDGEFCECPEKKHVLTNAHCHLNVILATNRALDFVYEESVNPILTDLKEDFEEEEDLKQDLISCFIEDDCGAEPFEPFTPKEQKAMAKKLLELADFGNRFHTDNRCHTPPLKAHNKTDIPTPLLECKDKLDAVLSPRDEAFSKQQVQVCAVQEIVSAPGGISNQQRSQQENLQQNAEEPPAQQIICAPVSRDPRISRTSLDTADPRLTDGKEKYKPKERISGELVKAPFGFKKDNAGNAHVDVVNSKEIGQHRDKNPPVGKGLPKEQDPHQKKSLPRGQNPPKPPTPLVPSAVPPPTALTPHLHKEIGCEVCSKIENDRSKIAAASSLPAKLPERRMSSKENLVGFNDSACTNKEKQPIQAPQKTSSVCSLSRNAENTLATHRIACSSAVALTSYRIPKRVSTISGSSTEGSPKPIEKNVSKNHSSIKPPVKLTSNNIKPNLPPAAKSTSEKSAISDQLSKLPKPGSSKSPGLSTSSRSESVKQQSSEKEKTKEKISTSLVHSSSQNKKSDKTQHISKPVALKPEKSLTDNEHKRRRYSDVDIFAPTSTNSANPKIAVIKDRKKEKLSGSTHRVEKSSKSKISTEKDKVTDALAAPSEISSKDNNITSSKSDFKKSTHNAATVTKNDSKKHLPAAKENTAIPLNPPALHEGTQLISLKETALAPVPSGATVGLGKDLPAYENAKELLQTLMEDVEVQHSGEKNSRCADGSASTSDSKESKKQDNTHAKKSKLSLPKSTQSKTTDTLLKSAAATLESGKNKTVPDTSVLTDTTTSNLKTASDKKKIDPARPKLSSSTDKGKLSLPKIAQHSESPKSDCLNRNDDVPAKSDITVPQASLIAEKIAVPLKIASIKKQLHSPAKKAPSSGAQSKLSRPKITKQNDSSKSDDLLRIANKLAERNQNKTVPDTNVLKEKVTVNLKVTDKKKQIPSVTTQYPLKAANNNVSDENGNISSSTLKVSQKLKRKAIDASAPKLAVKKLIITGKNMPPVKRSYIVLHSEEKSDAKKNKKLYDEDDDYEPSTSEEVISASELTSDGSASSSSYADENSSNDKLATRGKRRKRDKRESSSTSSESEQEEDHLSRQKFQTKKQEQRTSRKRKNCNSKMPSRESSKKHPDQRDSSRAKSPSSSDSDSELKRVGKRKRLASKSPIPSTSGKSNRVRILQMTDSSEDNQPSIAMSSNLRKVASDAKKRSLETKSPQPSTSGTQKYNRIVTPPSSSDDSSEDETPAAAVAPKVTLCSKPNIKKTAAPEEILNTLVPEPPVSATPSGQLPIPASFELSDDDVYTDDELHHGEIAGETPHFIDLYSCISDGLSIVINSTCNKLVVVGTLQDKKVEPPPPSQEIITEVVIAKEPEDDEVVPYVPQKKTEGPIIINLDSSEDEGSQAILIESSPSPEPPSPNQDSGISDSTMDIPETCAVTLSERLEPEMELHATSSSVQQVPAVNPVATLPTKSTTAPHQPDAGAIGQQYHAEPSCVATANLHNIAPHFIQTTIDQNNLPGSTTQIPSIRVTVLPTDQPQPLELFDKTLPQLQEPDRVEQEKELQEKNKCENQRAEFLRLKKKHEEELERQKKINDDNVKKKKEQEEAENRRKIWEQTEKKRREQEESEKKNRELEEAERKQRLQKEEKQKKIERELESQKKVQERLEREEKQRLEDEERQRLEKEQQRIQKEIERQEEQKKLREREDSKKKEKELKERQEQLLREAKRLDEEKKKRENEEQLLREAKRLDEEKKKRENQEQLLREAKRLDEEKKKRENQEQLLREAKRLDEEKKKRENQEQLQREAKRLEEEKKTQETQRSQEERMLREQQREEHNQQPASFQPRIKVIALEKLQQSKPGNHQGNHQPQSGQLPASVVHQQRLVQAQQLQSSVPNSTQRPAAPRQTPTLQLRTTEIAQPVASQATTPPEIRKLTPQDLEKNLVLLARAASNCVHRKITASATESNKYTKMSVTFDEPLVSRKIKWQLMNFSFQSWLTDSLPRSCKHWECIIDITLIAIKFLDVPGRIKFNENMQIARLDRRLSSILLGIQKSRERIYTLPACGTLEGFEVCWSQIPRKNQTQEEALDHFISKLKKDGVLKPEVTSDGKKVVFTPSVHCPLLQHLVKAYAYKYLRKYLALHPETERAVSAAAQPQASTSSNISQMVINPHASYLPVVAPGITHQQQQSVHSMMQTNNQTTIINTTMVTSTVHHRPAVALTQPLLLLPSVTVGNIVDNLVSTQLQQQNALPMQQNQTFIMQVQQPQSAQHQPQPAQHQPQPAQHQPQPAQHQPQPAQHQPQLAQHQPQPAQHQPQPAQYQPQPAQHQPQLAQHQPQPAQHQPQPAQHQPQPAQHQPQPAQHQWQPVRQQQQPVYQQGQQQPTQTIVRGNNSRASYSHELCQSSRQNVNDQVRMNQWRQQQQWQYQNRQEMHAAYPQQQQPSYSGAMQQQQQQQTHTQYYYVNQPQPIPADQPQHQPHFQLPRESTHAQQPTASPNVPNNHNAEYLHNELGLQLEQGPPDINTNVIGMDLVDDNSQEAQQFYENFLLNQ